MLAEILSRYKTGSSLIFTVTICLSCLIWKSNLLSRTANSASQALDRSHAARGSPAGHILACRLNPNFN